MIPIVFAMISQMIVSSQEEVIFFILKSFVTIGLMTNIDNLASDMIPK